MEAIKRYESNQTIKAKYILKGKKNLRAHTRIRSTLNKVNIDACYFIHLDAIEWMLRSKK